MSIGTAELEAELHGEGLLWAAALLPSLRHFEPSISQIGLRALDEICIGVTRGLHALRASGPVDTELQLDGALFSESPRAIRIKMVRPVSQQEGRHLTGRERFLSPWLHGSKDD